MRAPVVRRIYDMNLSGGVGITQIRDALNANLDRFPPPTCVDLARALGAGSRSSVWEILRNPKYTGYQVWNRRARKTAGNRDNPPEAWIWSEEPPTELRLLQLPALAPAVQEHPGRPSGACVPR